MNLQLNNLLLKKFLILNLLLQVMMKMMKRNRRMISFLLQLWLLVQFQLQHLLQYLGDVLITWFLLLCLLLLPLFVCEMVPEPQKEELLSPITCGWAKEEDLLADALNLLIVALKTLKILKKRKKRLNILELMIAFVVLGILRHTKWSNVIIAFGECVALAAISIFELLQLVVLIVDVN
jgi:hypothetical protein